MKRRCWRALVAAVVLFGCVGIAAYLIGLAFLFGRLW